MIVHRQGRPAAEVGSRRRRAAACRRNQGRRSDGGFVGRDVQLSRGSTPGLPGTSTQVQQGKVPFQLLLCNDDGCEVQEPADRSIRTRQRGVPHSQFSWKNRPRNVLVINEGEAAGFLFGTGVLSRFMEAYYAGGTTGVLKAVRVLARAVASASTLVMRAG